MNMFLNSTNVFETKDNSDADDMTNGTTSQSVGESEPGWVTRL